MAQAVLNGGSQPWYIQESGCFVMGLVLECNLPSAARRCRSRATRAGRFPRRRRPADGGIRSNSVYVRCTAPATRVPNCLQCSTHVSVMVR